MKAISSDGDNVVATMLLGPGAPLMAETAHTELPEPDNEDVVTLMRERIERLEHAATGGPLDPDGTVDFEEDMLAHEFTHDIPAGSDEDRTRAALE